ncbi:hypothetical protein [Flagellimonas ruestringensis]|nr:hypothetical protein [Allomuricauda ruestringensis]
MPKGKDGHRRIFIAMDGFPEELAKVLDLAVEMLFYLEEDTFDRKEVQQVVATLRGIVVGLRE